MHVLDPDATIRRIQRRDIDACAAQHVVRSHAVALDHPEQGADVGIGDGARIKHVA